MKTLHWLTEPIKPKSVFQFWLVSTILVFTIWFFVPIFLGIRPHFEFTAINLSMRNIALILSISFGEEFVFRVLPIVVVLNLFREKTTTALLVGIVLAYPFGMWHEWELTQKTFLGFGGIILTIVYLKFGGAYGKPFNGLLACGGIHAACNFIIALIANLATA